MALNFLKSACLGSRGHPGDEVLHFRSYVRVCPSLCRSRLRACQEEGPEGAAWSTAKERILVRTTVASEQKVNGVHIIHLFIPNR